MDLSKIKVEAFPQAVMEWCEQNSKSTTTSFCEYLEYIKGEIVARYFATRIKKKMLRVTEVQRQSTGPSRSVVKNLLFSYGAQGYHAVYEREDVYYHCGGYPIRAFGKEDFDLWYPQEAPCGFSYRTINNSMVTTIPEFKYCGFTGGGAISYINAWRKDKNIEFFGKMGLSLSPILINKAKKDGKFRRFLWENHKGIEMYGVQAAMFAYKHNITCEEARRACYLKNQSDRLVNHRIPSAKGTKIDRLRLLDYVDSNDIDYSLYNDYLAAIKALGYDLNDTKNVYPKDFKQMHDLRVAEYASYKAKIDRKNRAKLYADFRRAVKNYFEFEQKGEKYTLVIPRDISELIREGDVLGHCVGKMGYDKKVIDGKSLIVFCRENSNVKKPFATIEYNLNSNSISQFYAVHNSTPPKDAREFVTEWAKNVKKILTEWNSENVTCNN